MGPRHSPEGGRRRTARRRGAGRLAGRGLAEHIPGYAGDLAYTSPAYEALPELGADAVVLALPNGKAGHIVQQFDDAGTDAVLLDLSADFRFDDGW